MRARPSAFGLPVSHTAGGKQNALSDCRQKAILPPEGGRIALSANERIVEFLDFAIQAKFAYVNKLAARLEGGGTTKS